MQTCSDEFAVEQFCPHFLSSLHNRLDPKKKMELNKFHEIQNCRMLSQGKGEVVNLVYNPLMI
jgi:hypothetical protein